MDYIWELHFLICVFITIFGCRDCSVAGDEEESTLHPKLSKSSNVYEYVEATTESLVKKKNTMVDWRNNNILRDRNTHSLVTENVKSLLDDIMKNAVLNKSDSTHTNFEPVHVSIPYFTTVPSDTDSVEKPRFNVFDTLPRNTRDLIPNSGEIISNKTGIVTNNSTAAVSKEDSTSSYQEFDGKNRTMSASIPPFDKASLNRTALSLNQTNTTPITSLPPIIKNLKDKANKPKMEVNPKQFKKPSNNFKNKPIVISNYNVTIEAIKPENTAEYVTDDPINDNVTTDNSANIISWINGTSKYNSSNATLSSLRTLPESEGLQPLSIILIGAGIIALISVITAIGMFSVTLYRRYHWNKPQTFSDKCSNADSTGYIDDSTLKENSEEMYSLDNDSFLNSLEAMTIQNYWADSIRHTKL